MSFFAKQTRSSQNHRKNHHIRQSPPLDLVRGVRELHFDQISSSLAHLQPELCHPFSHRKNLKFAPYGGRKPGRDRGGPDA